MSRSLDEIIAARIRETGPLTIGEYMAYALNHPRYGYYRTRPAIGVKGDFITAPEISQMFGELIGVWIADLVQQTGGNDAPAIAECGPGRGTLIADVVRTLGQLGGWNGLDIHLLETNRAFVDSQRRALALHSGAVTWHETLDSMPDRPVVFVANEFLDAMPIRQFRKTPKGAWHEIMVVRGGDAFTFALAPFAADENWIPVDLRDDPVDSVVEISPATERVVEAIAGRIRSSGGAALFIDYGHASAASGDTLQAVRDHRYCDPLSEPGATDITAHVNFSAVAAVAEASGLAVFGPVTQGAFLAELGIGARARVLMNAVGAADVERAVSRLTAPDQMGVLFKVLACVHPEWPVPAGFTSVGSTQHT